MRVFGRLDLAKSEIRTSISRPEMLREPVADIIKIVMASMKVMTESTCRVNGIPNIQLLPQRETE